MADVIRTSPEYYPDEIGAANLGLATLRDNHGNSYSGHQLTCAGRSPEVLTYSDNVALLKSIHPHESLNFLRDPGEIPMLFDMESPLQSVCRKMKAQDYNSNTDSRDRGRQ